MSRCDLDAIQLQLKTAIQSHQFLVTKMKSDPQNADLRKQLHDLQREITVLSEKQKVIVQNLRKEIVTRQQSTPAPPVSKPEVQPSVPTRLQPIQPKPTNVPVSSVTVPVTVATNLVKREEVCPVKREDVCQVKLEGGSATPTPSANQNSLSPRSTSPPIRVPQYPLHRPSILPQGKPVGTKGMSYTSSLARRPSDSDLRDIRKTVERKQISPEEKEKLAYMAVLELVTQETLKEMQSRKHERKRRTTANPMYNFEPEIHRRRPTSLVLNSLPGMKRPRGRPPKHARSPSNSHPGTPDSNDSGGGFRNVMFKNGFEDVHEDLCAVCGHSGQLLLCDTCSKVYHLQCLDPPLPCVPDGRWSCPKCQASGRSSAWTSETLAIVHSFIANKAAKEEERKKLHKKSMELNNEVVLLESKTKQLGEALMQQRQKREELMETNRHNQQSVENYKNFIKVIQSS
ncbi:PHD finger protein 21A-like isoform X1 [Mizuhopecten yessoensis]|uniref:PHD finger protein 21A n=1 Tax=Mizuhopecten yessoensis TaxID=6573 RepID=A0A210QPJ8_MIZYE|nr:PHD finger protein 21A-like isoform X1 [Mizuhopecten yessoensis]OWF50666.1 PHD finger protein 21A [Mizuhopecten yessoensis]